MSVAGRIVRFPDRALGHLYNLLPDGTWEHLGRAQGRLWVPTAVRLHLSVVDPSGLGALAHADPHAFYSIDLHNTAVGDHQLGSLGRLSGLRRLYLTKTRRLSDDGLPALSRLWALSALSLDRTRVSDAGLPALASLRSLQELDLSHTRVRGRGLAVLAGLAGLRRLSVAGTGIDDGSLPALAALPSLQQVVLDGTGVTARGLAALLGKRPGLAVVGEPADEEPARRRPALVRA